MAAEAEPVAAPRPASAALVSGGAGGAIPGIGDAVAMPALPAAAAGPVDVFGVRAAPWEERGGLAPADVAPAGREADRGRRRDARDARSRSRSGDRNRKRRRSRSAERDGGGGGGRGGGGARPGERPPSSSTRDAFLPLPGRRWEGPPPGRGQGPPPFAQRQPPQGGTWQGPPGPGPGMGPPGPAWHGPPPGQGPPPGWAPPQQRPPPQGGPWGGPPPAYGRGRGRGGRW
jgi:hypothetical protein